MRNTNVYKIKENIPTHVVELNYDYDKYGVPYLQQGKMKELYPDWENDMLIAPEKYSYPIIDNLGNLRDKSPEELKLEGIGLVDGEVLANGEIIIIEKPEGLLEYKWTGTNWVEGKSPEEVKDHYFNTIIKHKSDIMLEGYEWKGHQQKVREKDVALLGNAIAGLEDYKPDGTLQWSFNDNDITALTLAELKELRGAGVVFINKVYEVEAILKSESPVVNYKVDEFKARIAQHNITL